MKNSKPDDRLWLVGLVVAGLAVCTFAACNRRTLTAGAVKVPPDARAPDGAHETAAPPDGTNADVRDPGFDAIPDGQSLSGPCGEATCLIDLFRTCVPEGSCSSFGTGSPSAVFVSTCYANGVQVSSTGSGTGTYTSNDWGVKRDGALCYQVKGYAPTGSSMSYTITGAYGEQVATGIASDQPGFVTVTCKGGQPTRVSSVCLEAPVRPSTCTWDGCPFVTSVDAGPPDGTNADAPAPDLDASPDGQSLAQPCGQATCLVDLFRTCVPEGDCAARLGSTAFYDICYANGVTAAYSHGGSESTTTVRRDGVLCYSINDSTPPNAGATSYVVTDGNGNEIATGVRAERSTTITVTCRDGEPTVVSRACLESPVDQSTCTPGGCPFGSSVDAGSAGGTTGGTGGSSGGAGRSTSDSGGAG